MQCVVFTLYGPLSSWGSIAVAEVRRSWGRPSKSAVLGLVAAALGKERSDEAAHAALERDWALAVRVDAPGTALLDYHTVQYPPSTGKRTFLTRRDELVQKLARGEKPDTKVLSRREYLQDAVFSVCLWPRVERPESSADDIADALVAPHFTPYLGRRSCPAAVPMKAQAVEADSPEAALAERGIDKRLARLVPREECDAYVEVAGILDEQADVHIVERRDSIHSRMARQFSIRREQRLRLPAPKPVKAEEDA